MDKKLNEVTKVTDMAYVPVIMSDGSIGQIAKADLASVVAGVFKSGNMYPFNFGGITPVADLDKTATAGQYWVSGSSQTNTLDWAGLLVFNCSGTIIQVKFNLNMNNIVWRKKNSTDAVWGNWYLISSTSL